MQNIPNYSVSHTKIRTFVQVPIYGDPNAVDAAVRACLANEGFHATKYTGAVKDEVVWKKGTGLASAMKFMKLLYQPNLLVITAWISSGLGPVGLFDMSLDGGYAFVPKKSCMKSVERVAQAAQSVPPMMQQNYVPQPPQQ